MNFAVNTSQVSHQPQTLRPRTQTSPQVPVSAPEQVPSSRSAFETARRQSIGTSTATVNPSQSGQQIKQSIDQSDGSQIAQQAEQILSHPKLAQEFGPAQAKGSETASLSEQLSQASQRLRPVSQHQVMSLDLSDDSDSTVRESTRSLKLGQGASAFAPERLSSGGTLEIVGHGSSDGKLLGGKTPQQLARSIQASGIGQLETLVLKSCHSAEFAKAVKNELTALGISCGTVRGFDSRIAIAKASGETIVETPELPLEQVRGHSGGLGRFNLNLQQMEAYVANAGKALKDPKQNPLNFMKTFCDILANSTQIVNSIQVGEQDWATEKHRASTLQGEAREMILKIAKASLEGKIDQTDKVVIAVLKDFMAKNDYQMSESLTKTVIEAGHLELAKPMIDAFRAVKQYSAATSLSLLSIQKYAEKLGRWDEDFQASFDSIQSKSGEIAKAMGELDHFYTRPLNELTQREQRAREREIKINKGVPDSLTLLGRVIDPSLGGILTKHEHSVFAYCRGDKMNKPGSSSMGTLDVSKEGLVKGRPAFSSYTQLFIPLKAGQHRRHIMAWHNIRSIGTRVLSSYETKTLQAMLSRAPMNILKEISGFLKVGDICKSDDKALLMKGVLFVMNSNPNNLWPGDGKINSSIATAWSTVNKALTIAGDNIDSLVELAKDYHTDSQLKDTPYRATQGVVALVIQAEAKAGSTPKEIRTAVLETLAGLEIDALGGSQKQTSDIFKQRADFINAGRSAYRWSIGISKEPPSQEQLLKFMEYPPGYELNQVKQEDYQKFEVRVQQQVVLQGLQEASRSQFQQDGGHTACTAMAMQGIAYAFQLGQTNQQAQQNGLNTTLSDGAAIFQRMHQSTQAMGYNLNYYHPTEIPDNDVTAAGLQRGATRTVAHAGTDVRDQVVLALNPNHQQNPTRLAISLVLGGATVSITRHNGRFFVYDSHGFQGVSQNAFMREFNNVNDAAALIHSMVQARVGNGNDASLTVFTPRN